jgi:hypothetical protein
MAKYSISVTQGDKTYKGTGNNTLEALTSLTKPLKIIGKCFLTVTDGKRKAELMMMPTRAKRLFFPNARIYLAKQLELLMK